jgi:hypothetical protein
LTTGVGGHRSRRELLDAGGSLEPASAYVTVVTHE